MLRMLKDIRPNNPTIAIRFCLDPADRAKIAELKDQDIRVLLVVAYENKQEDRQVVPLAQLVTYVGFRYPGKHRVLARLVWSDTMQNIENILLEKPLRNHFEWKVLDNEHNDFKENLPSCIGFKGESWQIQGDDFEIEVPREYFAKEPPAWLKRWANLWHKYSPDNQCEFRRRAILAFSVKWIAVLFFLICRTVGALLVSVWGLFWGLRRSKFGHVMHPWQSEITDILTEYKTGHRNRYGYHSWILSDKDGKKRLKTLFVSPPFLASCWALLHYLADRFSMTYTEIFMAAARWFVNLDFLGLGVVIATVSVIIYLLAKAVNGYVAYGQSPEYLARIEEEYERRRQELLKLLACPIASESANALNLKSIPAKHRSYKLYFYEAKRKVCKQFAG